MLFLYWGPLPKVDFHFRAKFNIALCTYFFGPSSIVKVGNKEQRTIKYNIFIKIIFHYIYFLNNFILTAS